jgi:hypothetical protein
MESELKDLKEIAIAKIKTAYNRSVDLEATHSVLWDKFDKNRKKKLIVTLILSLISTSSLILTITLSNLSDLRIYLFTADIFALVLTFIIIWEVLIAFTGRSEAHGRIVYGSYQLRDKSMDFLQNKLDNLDRQGYIDEIKTLEINDTTLKEKSDIYTKNLSHKTQDSINKKFDELEKQGIKKYFMPQEEINSANKKLQKFTALRTCEAWIKFN